MAKGIYLGSASAARRVKKLYVGVNGVARKVKKGYIGVNGVARRFYTSEANPFTDSWTIRTIAGTGYSLDEIVYGNGYYAILINHAAILYSTSLDGPWTYRNVGYSGPKYLSFANGKFFVFSLLTETDGASYSSHVHYATTPNGTWTEGGELRVPTVSQRKYVFAKMLWDAAHSRYIAFGSVYSGSHTDGVENYNIAYSISDNLTTWSTGTLILGANKRFSGTGITDGKVYMELAYSEGGDSNDTMHFGGINYSNERILREFLSLEYNYNNFSYGGEVIITNSAGTPYYSIAGGYSRGLPSSNITSLRIWYTTQLSDLSYLNQLDLLNQSGTGNRHINLGVAAASDKYLVTATSSYIYYMGTANFPNLTDEDIHFMDNPLGMANRMAYLNESFILLGNNSQLAYL